MVLMHFLLQQQLLRLLLQPIVNTLLGSTDFPLMMKTWQTARKTKLYQTEAIIGLFRCHWINMVI